MQRKTKYRRAIIEINRLITRKYEDQKTMEQDLSCSNKTRTKITLNKVSAQKREKVSKQNFIINQKYSSKNEGKIETFF